MSSDFFDASRQLEAKEEEEEKSVIILVENKDVGGKTNAGARETNEKTTTVKIQGKDFISKSYCSIRDEYE